MMRVMQRATILGIGVLSVAAVGAMSLAAASDLGGIASVPLSAGDPTDAPEVIPTPGTLSGYWAATVECLYAPGEPRALPPCVPPPPCHPSAPPMPYDLVGVAGVPSCGPIYRGPCEPRMGTHDDLPFWRLHRVRDRLFDWFYTAK